MKISNLIVTFILAMVHFANAQNKLPFELVKDWEMTGFENPESVVLDTENNVIYVSNVNGNPGDKDGNGYISKASLEGKILEQKWITGFNAPKGLTIYNGKLYVTDIDEIVEIDIKTKEKKTFPAEGATFLNDITADNKGNVYASNTFGFSGIYKLPQNGERKVELWVKGDDLNMPNGLYVDNNQLYIAGWGMGFDPNTYETETKGQLISLNTQDKSIKKITPPIGNLDGLAQTLHGFLLTDWLAGKLLYYSNKENTTIKVLDLSQGSADLFFDKNPKSIYIPLMQDGKILKYRFKN